MKLRKKMSREWMGVGVVEAVVDGEVAMLVGVVVGWWWCWWGGGGGGWSGGGVVVVVVEMVVEVVEDLRW